MAKIAVVLTPGFADWEYGLVAGIGGSFYGLDIGFFAPAVGEVRSQGGLAAVVSNNVGAIPDWSPKVTVVVGGTIWETENAPDLRESLRDCRRRGAAVAGICGGTLALARAGLLDETSHTSNDADFLRENGGAYAGMEFFVESAAAVTGEGVVTAPGTAPVSFAASVFEMAGLDQETVRQFRQMLSAEHESADSPSS